MASVTGTAYNPLYQPGTPRNPGTTIGTMVNPLEQLSVQTAYATNITLEPLKDNLRVNVRELIIDKPVTSIGTGTITSVASTLYTMPNNTAGTATQKRGGSGYIYVYTADFSSTYLAYFAYGIGTTPAGRVGFTNVQTTGTVITLNNAATPNLHIITAAIPSGSISVTYRVFHLSNYFASIT